MNRNKIANKIKRKLRDYKPKVYICEATGSIYISFLYRELGVIRVSDHKGKPCKWNITNNYSNFSKNFYPQNKISRFFKDIKKYIEMKKLNKIKNSYVWRKK